MVDWRVDWFVVGWLIVVGADWMVGWMVHLLAGWLLGCVVVLACRVGWVSNIYSSNCAGTAGRI